MASESSPTAEEILFPILRGALFDAAPFMDTRSDDEAGATSAATTPEPPLRASIIVDRLKLRGGATLAR